MSDHNVTIRHARNAVDLIIDGAVRRIENEYTAANDAECQAVVACLIKNIREELDCWEPKA